MNKIRKGDRVVVHTGRDKDKQDTVLAMFAEHVTAEDVNVTKKHVRPNPMLSITGGVVDKVIPIRISNVVLADANGKPSRVDIRVGGGVRTRILRTIGATVGA